MDTNVKMTQVIIAFVEPPKEAGNKGKFVRNYESGKYNVQEALDLVAEETKINWDNYSEIKISGDIVEKKEFKNIKVEGNLLSILCCNIQRNADAPGKRS
ncbi:MAG: hypothetical protein LBO09_02760 [Candidatus Peribacteria bacterium]|jgi:hypothetical protein|nr:hypothetical protein [Candidatus Peribacteria bacterium]